LPVVSWKNNSVLRSLYQSATPENMQFIGDLEASRMEQVDAYIGVRGAANSNEFSDVPAEKMDLYQRHWWKPTHIEVRVPKTRWVVLRYPTDSMAQALGGIAQAYSSPGQPLKTGIVSVADETCAILAFGGMLAALYCAETTGVGQKLETSLLGGQIRLMGWTLQTAMWKDEDPVTGQARMTGTPGRPSMSASFDDRDGKPLVLQLGGNKWQTAMTALGFWDRLKALGFGDLGVAVASIDARRELLAALDKLFATGSRDKWVQILRDADIVAAPINSLLEAANDPDVIANGYVTEIYHPKHDQKLKVHGTPWQFSKTPVKIGIAPELGEHNDDILTGLGYGEAEIRDLAARKVI